MNLDAPLDFCPLWLLFLVTVAMVGGAVEVGFWLGRYRREHAPEKETPVGAMVGAMLGLLAFMLAFTFGIAASRFDERRHMVVEDANVIGTTYLRAAMLKEPQRSEIRQLLREYLNTRLAAVQEGRTQQGVTKSVELQNQLWAEATVVAEQDSHSIINGLFIQSLNQMIDSHAKRVMIGLRSRLPAVVWAVLYTVAVLTMTTMGYQEGLSGTRRSLASLAVVLTFSVILLMIVDLDRPTEGFLRISQQSMLDLQESMRSRPL